MGTTTFAVRVFALVAVACVAATVWACKVAPAPVEHMCTVGPDNLCVACPDGSTCVAPMQCAQDGHGCDGAPIGPQWLGEREADASRR